MVKLQLHKIHEDDRGAIFLIKGDLKEHEEITLFTTKKGLARGGCIHKKNDEHCVVLEGKIIYYIGEAIKSNAGLLCDKGDSVLIPKNTPHYFIAFEDSLVMEWGATPEEKLEKHKETREIVEEINEKTI